MAGTEKELSGRSPLNELRHILQRECVEIWIESDVRNQSRNAIQKQLREIEMASTCPRNRALPAEILNRSYAILKERMNKPGGADGYLGNESNCDFALLFEVFGLDPIAHLFRPRWWPAARILRFDPALYLAKIDDWEHLLAGNLLRRVIDAEALFARSCKHGTGSPKEAKISPPHRFQFYEERDGWLLRHSIGELRAFGELAASLVNSSDKLAVGIHVWQPW